MKFPLPSTQIVVSLTKIGSEKREAQQDPVDDIGRKSQGLLEIDEQYDARFACLVPGFVFIGIVENENAPLTPASAIGPYSNSEIVVVFGDQQPEVKPQHSVVWTAVRRQ